MAYQVLSRKWRPKKFQEVVGQEHVTRSLQNAILKERLGHAYILTGTRGIGKTSVARLFAKSLRCLERKEDANSCNECKACLEFDAGNSMNVFEIDGASNNSVDDIRDLISSLQTLPTFGKYKVYIIDEVHMLSTNAFNALLKTLEEPPSHVIFLLATTEPEKLLNTVLSRCQRFDFRNASVDALSSHLSEIAEKEDIKFETPYLVKILASQGQGSFRDALSLLDQVLSFSENQLITEKTLTTALGLASISSIRNLSQSILMYDSAGTSHFYMEMLKENVGVENICRSIIDFLYELIQNIDSLEQLNFSEEVIAEITKMKMDEVFWLFESLSRDLSWAIDSLNSEKTVEIVFLKHAKRSEILQGSGIELSQLTAKKKVEISQIENTAASVATSIDEPLAKEKEVSPFTSTTKDSIVAKVEGPEFPHEEDSPPHSADADADTVRDEDEDKEQQTQPQPNVDDQHLHVQDWISFEEFFKAEQPAIYAELEQGNIVEKMNLREDSVDITYGFSGDAILFYDHLKTNDGIEKIEESMMRYFKVSRATLTLVSLDKEEAKEKNFLSKSDIREQEFQQGLEDTRQEIRNHPIVQEAEKIFNSKVDKIKINEE
jgi:DNA polymerase-3 subunit gamma/tau